VQSFITNNLKQARFIIGNLQPAYSITVGRNFIFTHSSIACETNSSVRATINGLSIDLLLHLLLCYFPQESLFRIHSSLYTYSHSDPLNLWTKRTNNIFWFKMLFNCITPFTTAPAELPAKIPSSTAIYECKPCTVSL
jgi:hypothetical protein